MKTLLIAAGLSLLTTSAFAATPLKPCSADQLKNLKDTIKEWKQKGLTEAKLINNAQGKTLGFYSFNKAGDEIYAEVCEYLSTDELTVASEWYYWEEENSADPKTWKKGEGNLIAQDEGTAVITVTKASPTGDIIGTIEIEGVEEEIIKKDTIRFVTIR